MAELKTSYMGLELRNPIIVASSGLTDSVAKVKHCEDVGAGAVVLKSIFEEQFMIGTDSQDEDINIYPEALDYMRRGGLMEYAPHDLIEMIEKMKREVNIPIIASINCQSPRLWPSFARQLQKAGADGLELNVYVLPIDLFSPGLDYEDFHLEILRAVKKEVTIPVAVKLTTQLTSVPYLGQRLAEEGCDALVLFNWFLMPDIDVKNLRTRSLKGKGDFHQSLRWVALLSGRLKCDIAASGGILEADHVVKQILAGADAVQVCTLLYQKGVEEIKNLLDGLEAWMAEHRYESIDDFKGEISFRKQELSLKNLGEAESYFRVQYLKAYSGMK
jgi:dihydroorotate dehydrogenase (fumarate)